MNDFKRWASSALAELEELTEAGSVGVYCHDHIRILRAAVRHGDELLYDIDMASLDGDAYRWEELTAKLRQRDAVQSTDSQLLQFIFTAGLNEDTDSFETYAEAEDRAMYLADSWRAHVTVTERFDRSNTWVAEYVAAVKS